MTSSISTPDAELKARHRKMWASGDYASMVETWLLPLGPRLVEACGIGPGQRVLDVGAGTGNASLPAAAAGADVTASDLTPELLEAGRRRADAAGLTLEWAEADAENLPFADGSFDVVMSAIGVMFAPHHRAAADELVRVCRPGGTIGLLSWTPEGMIGGALPDDGPVRAAAAARRASRRRCGAARTTSTSSSESASRGARSRAACSRTPPSSSPASSPITSARTTARRSSTRANAAKDGRDGELDAGAGRVDATSGTAAARTARASTSSTWSPSRPAPRTRSPGSAAATRPVAAAPPRG